MESYYLKKPVIIAKDGRNNPKIMNRSRLYGEFGHSEIKVGTSSTLTSGAHFDGILYFLSINTFHRLGACTHNTC